jgi:hypothetical protein
MDITMVLGGAIIAILQGMDSAGAKRTIAALHTLANRASCSPAERHVLQTIAMRWMNQPRQSGDHLRSFKEAWPK